MNANSPQQQYPPNYYYVPERKVAPKVKLQQPNFEIKPTMDLCNLYIKGIKPGLTSVELFNLFKPFGRIISARVMEDKNSTAKAGFGFVSYSSSIEAAQAMIEMYVEQPSRKEEQSEKKDTISPIMTVRFHEPRVPRPEHNYSQQLELLSNSPHGAHFYIRQKQKLVPLQPTEELQVLISTPPRSGNYPPSVANNSTATTSYFPVSNSNVNPGPPCYYYPSYWTDNQGMMYTNFITPPHPPPQALSTSPQYYQYNTHPHNKKKQHQQRHSWNGNRTTMTSSSSPENISEKLIELLKAEHNITPNNNPELVKKLMKLNRIEQSNCLNNSVYFKKKISFLMNNDSNKNNDASTEK